MLNTLTKHSAILIGLSVWVVLCAANTLRAQDSTPPSTETGSQSSPQIPDKTEKQPGPTPAELDEIMAIRKRLGGGVSEQLKGLNVELDLRKASKILSGDGAEIREILASEAQESPAAEEHSISIPPGYALCFVNRGESIADLLNSGDRADCICEFRSFGKVQTKTFLKNIPIHKDEDSRVYVLVSEFQREMLLQARKTGKVHVALSGNQEEAADSTIQGGVAVYDPALPWWKKPESEAGAAGPQTAAAPQVSGSSKISGIRKAARLAEDAAAELEQAGQFALADELRGKAQEIWESAR